MTKEHKAIRDALDAAAYQMEFLPKKMEIINKAYEALDSIMGVPAQYKLGDNPLSEAYKGLFGMLSDLKMPPVHSEMNDIINFILKHWSNNNLSEISRLEAKIRQKKGFYAISVGHDEARQAHKAGILKGLDIAHEEIKAMLSAAPKRGGEV